MARDLRREQDEAVRITTASSSRDLDIAVRQKRYLFSMTLRSLCFVGAIIAALAHVGWLWPILIAGALILPYIAVVMANATSTKSDGFSLIDSQYGRPELTAGAKSEPDTGHDRL